MQGTQQIAILGTGLLGGSVGLGLRAAGYEGRIVGFGRRTHTLDLAQQRGCIDLGTLDLGEALEGSDVIVLATPVGEFPAIFDQLARHGGPVTAITDVGSVKAAVVAQAQERLPRELLLRFVPAHPMAGSENTGPDAARADLFKDKPCIITADREVDFKARATVESLWMMLGMRLLHMTPSQHDQKVAAISHLPHCVAALLVNLASEQGALDVASTGFGDMTRIASGSPGMWVDILRANQLQVIHSIDRLAEHLTQLRHMLASDDAQQLRGVLEKARETRDQWRGTR